MIEKNEFTRCKYVSEQGTECGEWFRVDGGKFCPKYHRSIPNVGNKETFIKLMNSERENCFKMSNDELEIHIRDIEARIESFVQRERTLLASARAVRAERYEKMSEEERKELRKIQVGKDPNGKKPAPKHREDKATKMANNLGISRESLLTMDYDSLMEKFNKAKESKNE